jgi:hypothetical protein
LNIIDKFEDTEGVNKAVSFIDDEVIIRGLDVEIMEIGWGE